MKPTRAPSTPAPPRDEPAAMLPLSGSAAVPPQSDGSLPIRQEQTEVTEKNSVPSVASCSKESRPSPDRRASLRAEQLLNYRTRRFALGLSPAAAAAELGLSRIYLERLDRRERQHGPAALRPGFTTRKPRQVQAPITIIAESLLRRRPRRPADRRAFNLNTRLIDLGRYLQLRSQGHSLNSSARQMGRAASYVWKLDRNFRRAGLFGVARVDRQRIVYSAPGFEIVASERPVRRPPRKEAA